MSTFHRLLSPDAGGIPFATSWLLDELATFRGKQELYELQAPERLERLRESALIESAISSNRIEAVTVAPERIGTVLFGKTTSLDRNEEEVRGYRKALVRIHEEASPPLSADEIQVLHKLVRASSWDAGEWKHSTEPIIERYSDGSTRERFMPVDWKIAPDQTRELVKECTYSVGDKAIPIPVAIAAFNLDFLCIHPFRDGNGRVSRLLILQQLYSAGYNVGRYVSIERIIEESKDRYYETLEQSSQLWHEERHDPWPFINYLVYTLVDAYKEFERRWQSIPDAKGAKSDRVSNAIDAAPSTFTISRIEQACPGVSRELIRKVLVARVDVRAVGRGPGAKWKKG